MQTNYNEVAVLQQGAGKVTGARKLVKKLNIHMRDIEMSCEMKMKRLKRKMEVQKITFNYFAWPQPRNWNFFMQWWWWPCKKYCCPVSKFVVGVWDGLDESDISRPEILFQSAPGSYPVLSATVGELSCYDVLVSGERGHFTRRNELTVGAKPQLWSIHR